MNRNIILPQLNAPKSETHIRRGEDDYKTRILKLIPAEIVGAYLTMKGLIETAAVTPTIKEFIYWTVFIVLLVLTPIFYRRVTGVTSGKQLAITTLAFVVWTFSIGGPLGILLLEHSILTSSDLSLISSIFLILFTLISPMFFMEAESTSPPSLEGA